MCSYQWRVVNGHQQQTHEVYGSGNRFTMRHLSSSIGIQVDRHWHRREPIRVEIESHRRLQATFAAWVHRPTDYDIIRVLFRSHHTTIAAVFVSFFVHTDPSNYKEAILQTLPHDSHPRDGFGVLMGLVAIHPQNVSIVGADTNCVVHFFFRLHFFTSDLVDAAAVTAGHPACPFAPVTIFDCSQNRTGCEPRSHCTPPGHLCSTFTLSHSARNAPTVRWNSPY